MTTIHKGLWDANTNTPALASGVGSAGDSWIVSVTGTTDLDGITNWQVGDHAIFSGNLLAWERLPDPGVPVNSVNTQTGVVALTANDIPEDAPTRLWLAQTDRDDIAGKAETVHTHLEADVTDLDKYAQATVDGLLAPKLDDVVEDTSPQLGGNLDTNGWNIRNTGTELLADLEIFNDNGDLKLGTRPLNKTQLGYEDSQHGNLKLNANFFPFQDGTAGQALVTDGLGNLDFEDMPDMDRSVYDANQDGIVDAADQISFKAHNANDPVPPTNIPPGGTMTRGTCVFPSGKSIGEILEVRTSSRLVANTMPAIAILIDETLPIGQVGTFVSTGMVSGLDTSAWLVGAYLYVDDLGQLTNVEPAFDTSQRVGRVTISDPVEGCIEVSFMRGERFKLLDDTTPQLRGNLDTRGFNLHGVPLLLNGFNFPATDATANWVLATDGLGTLHFRAPGAGTGLGAVVEDLTPQLGGNLDVNTRDIISATDVTIQGLKYPKVDGLANYVVMTDGLGVLTLQPIPNIPGWITELIEDLTPQLGGNLDVNGFDIGGGVTLQGLVYPTADGLAGWVVKTDGAGNLTLQTFTHTHLQSEVSGLESRLTVHEDRLTVIESDYLTDAVINHSAPLGGSAATVPSESVVTNAINSKITSIPLNHKGTWDSSTNTPTLASGVGTDGDRYIVNVAGSTNLDGIAVWAIGDLAIFTGVSGMGGVWQKVPNTGNVASVNGFTGVVVLDADGIAATASRLWLTPAIQADIDQKTDTGHTHLEADMTNLDKFTQAEVNALLAAKANSVHAHLEADVTDLDKYTQAEIDSQMAGKTDTGHTHTEVNITDLDKYTQVEVDAALIEKAATIHDHDANYAPLSHSHGGPSGGVVAWGTISGTLSDQVDLQSALDLKATVANLSAHIADLANPHAVTQTQVGLSAVDNTADADKPVSTAQQTALDLKEDDLGNPSSDGDILSSTIAGARSWVTPGGAAWGAITGTLSAQTDLQSALDLKGDIAGQAFTTASVNGVTLTNLGASTDFLNAAGTYGVPAAQAGTNVASITNDYLTDLTGTTTPPQTGSIRWNNATQNLATELYIDNDTQVLTDVGVLLLDYFQDSDFILIIDNDDADKFQRFQIISITDNTTFLTLGVVNVSSSGGNLADEQELSFEIYQEGPDLLPLALATENFSVTTTVIVSSGTWVRIANTLALDGLSVDFTVTNNNELTYGGSINHTRPYEINANISIEKMGGGSADTLVGVFKNGSLMGPVSRAFLSASGVSAAVSVKGLSTISVGDVFDIRVQNETDADDFLVSFTQFSVTRS